MASNLIKNASVQKTGTVPNGRRETSNVGSKALTIHLFPLTFHDNIKKLILPVPSVYFAAIWAATK
jgi:hypothetical protein